MTTRLNSFSRDRIHAVVVGNGGIGGAVTRELRGIGSQIQVEHIYRGATSGRSIDLDDEASIASVAAIVKESGPVDLAIVATGILHRGSQVSPEKSLKDIDPEALAELFRINATGPLLVAKHFLPLMRRQSKSVFAALSARVGSIDDNRLGGWYAYRASKAALNMLIKTASIEQARSRPESIVVGLHPGTVKTELSAPFQRNVPRAQLFSPTFAATRLLEVIDGLKVPDTGGVFAWDGSRIAC